MDCARTLYERALSLDPTLGIAHHGYAQLLDRTGDDAGAARHRSLGLRYRPIVIERFLGEGRPVRVLALGTEAQGNIPTYGFFDNRIFLLASVTVEYAQLEIPLPPHDIVFNAIGEADLCADQLARAAALVARSTAPVVNHPAAVAKTGRVSNSRRFAALAGVIAPRIASLSRQALSGPDAPPIVAEHGFTYPLLLRSPGYHTGDHFTKIECAAGLADAANALPGDELLVIEYLDLRNARGEFRKYRVIIVDGRLYPLHLAISRAWKVHYFSADMAESAEHRAEEASFLGDMAGVLGSGALAALERVRDALALDYGGIDFALDAAGNVIVFEANASMIVPQPDPGPQWDHRREPVARIQAAVRDMLVNGPQRAKAAAPITHEA